jgi:hypothetical protein
MGLLLILIEVESIDPDVTHEDVCVDCQTLVQEETDVEVIPT